MIRQAAAAVLAALALAACTSVPPAVTRPTLSPSSPAPSSGALKEVHDPGQVTGSEPLHCQVRGSGTSVLPDPACTPGAIDPAVNPKTIFATICVHGWTATVRPPETQTSAFKFNVAYPAYGIPARAKSELDHLVPLELGGANDAANLWPETGTIPNPKDGVESALRAAVCSGEVPLLTAQLAIARDWLTAEKVLGLG